MKDPCSREEPELGLDLVSLHHVGGDQERFIDELAARVLPQLRQA